ncbi:hypothetical protein [Sulfurisphaera javensis]
MPLLIGGSIIIENLSVFQSLLSGNVSISTTLIEKILIIIVFLLIVPIIHLAVRKNSRGLISASSLILQYFNPTYSFIFYFSGISFNENYIDGILSFLPFIYLLFNYNIHNLIVPLIFLLIASIIYSYNKHFYSIIGVFPLAISAYYLSTTFGISTIYYGIILSAVINVIDKVINTTKNIKENKEAFFALKNKITEEIKNITTALYSIKSDIGKERSDIIKLLDTTQTSLSSLQNKLNECNNLKCLNEINDELNNSKRILTIEINNVLFDLIREYNDFTLELKKIGVNLTELEYPKEEIKIEEIVNFYRQLKQTIESNLILATNIINNMIENLSKDLGIMQDKITIINMNFISSKLNGIDVSLIDKKLNSCTSKALEVVSVFGNEEDYELKKSLADLSLQQFTVSKLNNATKILEKINNIFLVDLSALNNSLKALSSIYNLPEIDNLTNLINIEIQTLQTPDMPYCEKISRLYNSISEIKEAIELANNKDTLTQLSELVETLLPQILETGEVNLDEVGINDKYVNFIIALLNKKGFNAKVEGNKILLKINSKE